jgi:hypothetical protein
MRLRGYELDGLAPTGSRRSPLAEAPVDARRPQARAWDRSSLRGRRPVRDAGRPVIPFGAGCQPDPAFDPADRRRRRGIEQRDDIGLEIAGDS